MGRRRPRSIAIIAACTGSKTLRVPASLQLRGVRAPSLEKRAQIWAGRLADADIQRVPARSLYAGQHWAGIERGLVAAEHHGLTADLWIASAGLGLVAGDELVPPYSATFAPGAADSVRRGEADGPQAAAASRWWSLINRRSMLEAVAEAGYDAVVVAAGSSYIEAMADELRLCASPTRPLLVASVGARHTHADLVLDIPASVQRELGGSLGSLNARALEHVIQTHASHRFDRDAVQQSFDALAQASRTRMIPTVRRPHVSDEEVREVIRSMLREAPELSRTRALTTLRQQHGIACEQSRFAGLFESVS